MEEVETKKSEGDETIGVVEFEGAASLFANFEFGTKTVGRAAIGSDKAIIVTSDDSK